MNKYITSFRFEAENDDTATKFMEAMASVVLVLRNESHPKVGDLRVNYIKEEQEVVSE